jgi:AcrR family transcriptional regulator
VSRITNSVERSGSRAERSAQRRGHITAVATQQIMERGFENLSVNDLAAAVGISVGGMYRYINTKTDLLVMVCQDIYGGLRDQLGDLAAGPEPNGFLQSRRRYVTVLSASDDAHHCGRGRAGPQRRRFRGGSAATTQHGAPVVWSCQKRWAANRARVGPSRGDRRSHLPREYPYPNAWGGGQLGQVRASVSLAGVRGTLWKFRE